MITQTDFSVWLCDFLNENDDKTYRHRLFNEYPNKRSEILKELTSYVQNAHEDARSRLRKAFENPLDPLGAPPPFDPTDGYPGRFHMQTLKGYFGEIFAGLIAEHFSPFKEDGWKVPAFLFRYHEVEFQQLESLRQTGGLAKKRPGRTGDDCLAFQLDDEGQIIRYLYIEAKCTSAGSMPKMILNAYKKASESKLVDLRQIIEILQLRNDVPSKHWIYAIQQLWFQLLPQGINQKSERCDMVSYICGKSPKRGGRLAWLPVDKPHPEYKANRRLEVVEIHLPDIESLIREVYHKKDDIEELTSLEYDTEDEEDDSTEE
jgi:hypothetical protein